MIAQNKKRRRNEKERNKGKETISGRRATTIKQDKDTEASTRLKLWISLVTTASTISEEE